MAKGRKSGKRKKTGAISRFVQCLMCCCGRRPRNVRVCENEAPADVQDEPAEANSAENVPDIAECVSQTGSLASSALTEEDEIIETRGKAALGEMDVKRRYMLSMSIPDRMEEFGLHILGFFQSIGADPDGVTCRTDKRESGMGTEVVFMPYSATMFVSFDDGAITYVQAFWDGDAWLTRTYEETYWGVRLVERVYDQ